MQLLRCTVGYHSAADPAMQAVLLMCCAITCVSACRPDATVAVPVAADSVQLQSLELSASGPSPTSGEGWIFTWRKGASSGPGSLNTAACSEAGDSRTGRFNATCTHRFAAALPGFAARFRQRAQLARFLEAYADQLESAAPDGVVSLRRVGLGAGDVPTSAAAVATATAAAMVEYSSLDTSRQAWGLPCWTPGGCCRRPAAAGSLLERHAAPATPATGRRRCHPALRRRALPSAAPPSGGGWTG